MVPPHLPGKTPSITHGTRTAWSSSTQCLLGFYQLGKHWTLMRILFSIKRGTCIHKFEKHWDREFDLCSRSTKIALVTMKPRATQTTGRADSQESYFLSGPSCSCTVVFTGSCISVFGSQTRFLRDKPSPEEGQPWSPSRMRREGAGAHRLQSLIL